MTDYAFDGDAFNLDAFDAGEEVIEVVVIAHGVYYYGRATQMSGPASTDFAQNRVEIGGPLYVSDT